MSRMYSYVRSRQLEGSYNSDPATGNWIITAMRIARGWGAPPEEAWPYDGDASHWPPKQEPPNIDQLAKPRRILAYQRVRSVDECKAVLAQNTLVLVAFRIDQRAWSEAPGGVIPMPSIFKRPVAAHSVVLVGYEEQKKHFIVRNSWGEQWGDKGYGYLRYAYFSRYQLEAWILGPVHASRARSGTDGIYEQQWGTSDHFAKSPLHGFEIFDGAADECIGWAFVVEREGMAEIEELFVRPGYRRKGYGRRLAQMIKLSQRLAERPLKIWGSHADKEAAHSPAANQLFRLLNLSVRSPVREKWASFVAE